MNPFARLAVLSMERELSFALYGSITILIKYIEKSDKKAVKNVTKKHRKTTMLF